MLTNILSKPIEVTIGEQTHKFNSLADFEFSLAGRTSVPAKKIKKAIKLSLGELKKEYKKIKVTEKELVSVLSKSMSQPESCLLYTSPSPRDLSTSRMPSSA